MRLTDKDLRAEGFSVRSFQFSVRATPRRGRSTFAPSSARPMEGERDAMVDWTTAPGYRVGIVLPTPSEVDRALCRGVHTNMPGNAHAPKAFGAMSKNIWRYGCRICADKPPVGRVGSPSRAALIQRGSLCHLSAPNQQK